ncbi:hypothetical protein GTR02_05025 [Kineococcus sp. R8]|uniref:hypothetical protein n=1 Tax=Kineococcus siccus TaxID=2696567 RepID=UPI001412AC38|nr:hypothetical protein [Kineococcus siccus]NAZ81174.1 hypothetical protein [Kineococcus siccus]
MTQQVDAFGVVVQRGAVWGALVGGVLAGSWSGSAVSGEDALAIVAVFVVLGALAGSGGGVACGTLAALVHQAAERHGAAQAWWVAAAGALITGLLAAVGLAAWPVVVEGAVAPGWQLAGTLVCAVVAAWQVRRVQRRRRPAQLGGGPRQGRLVGTS